MGTSGSEEDDGHGVHVEFLGGGIIVASSSIPLLSHDGFAGKGLHALHGLDSRAHPVDAHNLGAEAGNAITLIDTNNTEGSKLDFRIIE